MKRELAVQLKAFGSGYKKFRAEKKTAATPDSFIKEARELVQLGVTNSELAEAMGLSSASVLTSWNLKGTKTKKAKTTKAKEKKIKPVKAKLLRRADIGISFDGVEFTVNDPGAAMLFLSALQSRQDSAHA